MQAMASALDPPRPAPAGALRLGDEVEAGLGLEEVDELGDEFEPLLAHERLDVGKPRLEGDSAVARLQDDAVVVARLDAAGGVQSETAKLTVVAPGWKR